MTRGPGVGADVETAGGAGGGAAAGVAAAIGGAGCGVTCVCTLGCGVTTGADAAGAAGVIGMLPSELVDVSDWKPAFRFTEHPQSPPMPG